MPYLLNIAYALLIICLSPWLAYKAFTTGKYRRGLWQKLTGRLPAGIRAAHAAPVWFHGVSVGEVHLLRTLVARFRERHPDVPCVISTTTDTGFAEVRKWFPDVPAFYWPLDFTWAVQHALRTVGPRLVVLVECELWPNFLTCAKSRGVPVAVVNARMSPRSFGRFKKYEWLTRTLFERVRLFAAQTEDYASCLRGLGAADVRVTGSIKYDGVRGERDNPRTRDLRKLLQIADDDLVWVVGSTQDPEESHVLEIYKELKATYPALRLILVPRQRERFEEAARLIQRSGIHMLRLSELDPRYSILEPRASIVLGDTFGDLAALWGLADLAFVGGSMDGKRGGQNMIEPAAFGAAVLFGPHVWNFPETVERLLKHDAAVQVKDRDELAAQAALLLADPERRAQLGAAARQHVLEQQGAAERTLELLDCLILPRTGEGKAA